MTKPSDYAKVFRAAAEPFHPQFKYKDMEIPTHTTATFPYDKEKEDKEAILFAVLSSIAEVFESMEKKNG